MGIACLGAGLGPSSRCAAWRPSASVRRRHPPETLRGHPRTAACRRATLPRACSTPAARLRTAQTPRHAFALHLCPPACTDKPSPSFTLMLPCINLMNVAIVNNRAQSTGAPPCSSECCPSKEGSPRPAQLSACGQSVLHAHAQPADPSESAKVTGIVQDNETESIELRRIPQGTHSVICKRQCNPTC